jgi:hypothetical protein
MVIIAKSNVHYSSYCEGEYENTFGTYGCAKSHPPPSAQNAICKIFHDKIAEIAKKFRKSEKHPVIDDDFVKQWLYHRPPAESLLVPTEDIRWVVSWGPSQVMSSQ